MDRKPVKLIKTAKMFTVSQNPHIPLRFELCKQRHCSQLSKTSRRHVWLNALEGQICRKYIPLYQRHSHYVQFQRLRKLVFVCLWQPCILISHTKFHITTSNPAPHIQKWSLFQHSWNHCTVTKFSSRHTHMHKTIRNLAPQKKPKDE